MNDALLDREIESLFGVEPSREFVARVRARVAEEPAPGGWRASWMFAVAGAATVVIVAVMAWPSGSQTPATDTRVQRPRAAEAIETPTPRAPLADPPVRRRVATPRMVTVAAAPDRALDIDFPDVVIAENEAKAYATLVSIIRRSRFDVSVPAAPDPSAPLEVTELPPVEPLEIEPLVKLATLE